MTRCLLPLALVLALPSPVTAQGTRLLRQPTVSAAQIAFEYGGDLWIVDKAGGEARRLTSTPAVEADPQFSPDGRWIAFTSNRSGNNEVYAMPAEGGDPRRLTWHPGADEARGWSPDGKSILFSSTRNTAPTGFGRLWTVPAEGGVERLLPAPMAVRGSWSSDGKRLVYDRVSRWDVEFRNYRGGQNTPLTILDPASLEEIRLPNERSADTQPVWVGQTIYFLSDRDYAVNVWAYDVGKPAVRQISHFKDADVKSLTAGGGSLVIEQDGYLQTLDPATGTPRKLTVTVHGDFPWAATRWIDVSRSIAASALSPTGKRALFESRGDIFTVPVEKGDARNLTHSPGAADRTPVWSSDGKQVAWFSDAGKGYRLMIGPQDGLTPPREIPIGEAKFAYTARWSPDGKRIAFTDDHSRLRVLEVATGAITTADTDGNLLGRGEFVGEWSPDSKWLAYSKAFPNRFRRIVVWSLADGKATPVTDALADAVSPAWDRNGRYLYFLASTDLGLASGWANISSIGRQVTRGAYITLLRASDSTPFQPQSDEEAAAIAARPATPPSTPPSSSSPSSPSSPSVPSSPPRSDSASSAGAVRIDFAGLDHRILALQVPVRDYADLATGPTGIVFLAERIPLQPGTTLHKYDLSKRKADVFLTAVGPFSISGDGKKLLYQSAGQWTVTGTEAAPRPGEGRLTLALQAQLDPSQEWAQIFDEAWRMERDFFYDPKLHGADWPAVYTRYAPLIPYVRHRSDLNYVLDQVGGELSVGHSFTRGGDMPGVDTTRTGLLGADLMPDGDRWKIARIFTGESWNPELRAPLDAPGLKVRAGNYILEVDGAELRVPDNPSRLLDGTAEKQTVLRVNDRPALEGSWTVTVVPLRSENALRTRAWVEDNRRKVDSLSGGRLAYVWVPNTGGPGYASFNRYFFAQQDKLGAVIDERFNGGGLLDDYMVDYMSRQPIGGVSNEAPGGAHYPLPMAGVLGPKVLLVNELAGSGGDYFPWAFHELKVGPLIGTRTWGGLVASAVPYPLVDGGTITAPSSAVFTLRGEWPAEGEGIPPDIEVLLDAKSVGAGRDAQLERGVTEALKLLAQSPPRPLTLPAPSKRARRPAP
jgi:tricorn protease